MHALLKYFFLIINFILILINFSFLFSKRIKKVKKEFYVKTFYPFKNVDNFIFKLLNNNYLSISNYLNNKYKFISLIKRIRLKIIDFFFLKKRRKKIILYSVDLFSFEIHKKWLKTKMKDNFIVKFKKENPDYLIYNAFGDEHLNPKYNNSIKIAILTENQIPDFSEADYAIGHYHINYLDRYFKYSIFFWQNLNNDYFYSCRNKVVISPKRSKFCAALITNNYSTDGFRINFINELNKYKQIDMGGQYNNNLNKSVINKNEFLSSYKFSIAMENSEGDGYISEKIVDSFISGTIPIYYGDYMIDEFINPKSFILIRGEKDMLEKIEYIKKIDNDDNLYKTLLKYSK